MKKISKAFPNMSINDGAVGVLKKLTANKWLMGLLILLLAYIVVHLLTHLGIINESDKVEPEEMKLVWGFLAYSSSLGLILGGLRLMIFGYKIQKDKSQFRSEKIIISFFFLCLCVSLIALSLPNSAQGSEVDKFSQEPSYSDAFMSGVCEGADVKSLMQLPVSESLRQAIVMHKIAPAVVSQCLDRETDIKIERKVVVLVDGSHLIVSKAKKGDATRVEMDLSGLAGTLDGIDVDGSTVILLGKGKVHGGAVAVYKKGEVNEENK